MKTVLLILTVLLLAACDNSYRRIDFPVIPDDLKDCKFYYLRNKDGEGMNVVRCPRSSTTTTYRQGKTTHSVTVED